MKQSLYLLLWIDFRSYWICFFPSIYFCSFKKTSQLPVIEWTKIAHVYPTENKQVYSKYICKVFFHNKLIKVIKTLWSILSNKILSYIEVIKNKVWKYIHSFVLNSQVRTQTYNDNNVLIINFLKNTVLNIYKVALLNIFHNNVPS